jgi:putative hemolysin
MNNKESKVTQEPLQIDIEAVIKKKNPRLLKILPGFLLRYIKRILHQQDINAFLRTHGHLYDLAFCEAIVHEFGAKLKIVGADKIDLSGRFIFAANHPLGGLDGIALMLVIGQKHPGLKFVVNDILANIANLKGLLIPVNKHGRNSAEMVKRMNELYESELPVLIFPAGLVSRQQAHGIEDLEWKKSFITKARQYNRDIIPVHIEGENSQRFYRVARWRKRLGIKANIEMFFLVDEMYRQKGKTITITFGEPIPYESMANGESDNTWAHKIKKMVYQMSNSKNLHKA